MRKFGQIFAELEDQHGDGGEPLDFSLIAPLVSETELALANMDEARDQLCESVVGADALARLDGLISELRAQQTELQKCADQWDDLNDERVREYREEMAHRADVASPYWSGR